MKPSTRLTGGLLATVLACAASPAAWAGPTIANGGFESGLAGWTTADQIGSFGTFALQSGTASPINADPVPTAPQGLNAAMSDGDGPGAHVLYQDFLASAGPATLGFQLFIGNRADRFANPDTLDYSVAAINMQARVDILAEGADPFSMDPADILMSLYSTQVDDTLVSGYALVATDITALMATHAGQTLRLRFAETDNLAPLQMGVDDVKIQGQTVAEPASVAMAGLALAALAWRRRRP